MKLSIIIIGYNTSKELEVCLESINKQKTIKKNIDVLYIDDGSTDNSVEIFNSFELKFYKKCIVHKKNLGRNHARNSGIINAKGSWCLFINSNIFLNDDVVDKYLNEIIKTNYNILTSNIKYICSDKQFELYLNNSKRAINGYIKKQTIPYYYLLFSNACIKTSVLKKSAFNKKFSSYGGSEMEFSYKLNQKNKILFVPNIVCTRLNHPSLINHIIRLEEFGKNNLFFLLKKIKPKKLPYVYKFFKLFFNKGSFLFFPFLYLIRSFIIKFLIVSPNILSLKLIKCILGLSILIGITKHSSFSK